MNEIIKFFVPGKPACAGSKKAFLNRKTGKIIIAPDDERSMPWRTNVQGHALRAMQDCAKIEYGPVHLEIHFSLARPGSHYRTGKFAGTLKDNAPRFVTTKPDLTKIVRAIEDALTGVCWKDDSQVVAHETRKLYADPQGMTGAEITISALRP